MNTLSKLMQVNLNTRFSYVNILLIGALLEGVHNLFMWDRIDKRLTELGWIDADLARALDVTSQYVNNWRKRGLPPSRFAEVAIALKKPPEWLLTDERQELRISEAGAPYATTDDDVSSDAQKIAAIFLELDARDRLNLFEIANTLARNESLPPKLTNNNRGMPHGRGHKAKKKGASKT